MVTKLANNASSTLAGSINSVVTSLSVASGDAAKFPALGAGEWFPLTVADSSGNMEIMRVTARSGAALTVVRGQEGTTAKSFASGSKCEVRLTAASLLDLPISGVNGLQTALDGKADDTEITAVYEDLGTLEADLASGLGARVKFLGTGVALPTSDIGPIWHADYASIMTWQVFTANGAAYTGYASVDIGRPRTDGRSTPRTGEVKRNGSALSKTTYAALWNWALHNGRTVVLGSWTKGPFVFADNGDGTFKLPDNRGEFERGWDDGRGVDASRVFGSWQDGQNLAHTHAVTDPGHTHTDTLRYGTAVGSGQGIVGNNNASLADFINSATTGISIQSSGGAEARSRNLALLYTIKF